MLQKRPGDDISFYAYDHHRYKTSIKVCAELDPKKALEILHPKLRYYFIMNYGLYF